jgi:two-component system, cell cycle sensor histidine kinase and response regulator CckA
MMRFNTSQLIARAKSPLLLVNAAGIVEFVNDAALVMLAQPREAVEGLSVSAQRWRLLSLSGEPLTDEQRPYRMATMRGGERPSLTRLLLELEDKSRRAVEFDGEVFEDDGRLAVLFAINDISELYAAREELLAKEEHLLEAQSIARVGSWYYDLPGQTLRWSPHVFQLLGLDPTGPSPSFEEFLGWIPEEERGPWMEAVQPTFGDGRAYEIAHRLILPDGSTRHVLSRGCGKWDLSGQLVGISGTAQDVTEHYLLEQQRVSLLNELHEAQRLRGIGLLAGGIAHDFNNLLAGVIGNTSFLQDDLSENPGACALLDDVMLAARQMMELTNHLLAYSGKSQVHTRRIEIYSVMMETYHVIRLSIPPGCDFVMERPEDAIWVDADPGHLRQVLLNLIVNAADAVLGMPRGSIRLRMRVIEAPPAAHTNLLSSARRFAHITIQDNGVGMDTQTMNQIFEPFFTTKATGRGLGLSAVQGFVRTMGGALDVSSVMGEGTLFELYLPVSSPEEEAREAPHGVIAGLLSGRILVVDDEVLVQNVCQRTLEREGLEVITASSGEEALGWLAACDAPPDVVLIDVIMPGIGGVGLLERLRELELRAPVIIMSGYTEQSVSVALVDEAQGVFFLQKPFYPQELRDVVASALER